MDESARWQAVRKAILGVEAAHEAWLRSQPGRVPDQAITAARLAGQLARDTLAALPQQGDPGAWIAAAVVAIERETAAFRASGLNDADSFGVASLMRVGAVLRALHEQWHGQPVEARFAAYPLRSELLQRLADWRRQCGDEAWEVMAGEEVKREHAYLWRHTVSDAVPEALDGEPASAWFHRVRAWAANLPAEDRGESAGREGIRNIVGRLGREAGLAT